MYITSVNELYLIFVLVFDFKHNIIVIMVALLWDDVFFFFWFFKFL